MEDKALAGTRKIDALGAALAELMERYPGSNPPKARRIFEAYQMKRARNSMIYTAVHHARVPVDIVRAVEKLIMGP